MAYRGMTAPIPLGQLGLVTDDPQSEIPPNAAITANNVTVFSGRVEKARGSQKSTDAVFGTSPVVALYDYWPDSSTQRLFAVTADGHVARGTGSWPNIAWSYLTVDNGGSTSSKFTSATNSLHMVQGGAEAQGRARKLFILGPSKPVQVVVGDASAACTAISLPALDWSGSNQPTFGIVFGDRMVMFGNANDRHRLYVSKLGDHEDFQDISAQFIPVYAGEGEGLISAAIYRGLLLLFKKPFGVYVLDISQGWANYTVSRFSDAFGLASPHAVIQAMDDLLGGTSGNSVISLKASQNFGDFEAGDVLSMAKVRNYVRENLSQTGCPGMHAVYYPDKEIAMFTTRSSTAVGYQDRLIMVDVARKSSARVSIETKDAPQCLALRRDANNVLRPMYGGQDGHVYLMDQDSRNVGDAAFTGEYQTAYTDLSFADASLASKGKIFDFLQLTFMAMGNWSFRVDVYIDGHFIEQLTFTQNLGDVLGSFMLDVSHLGAPSIQTQTRPLHCSGNTISFRIYNDALNESFRVERMVLGFRKAGESARSSRS